MKVILHAAALRAKHKAARNQPVELPDELAAHYCDVGVAVPVSGKKVETATRKPAENAKLDLHEMSKEDLVAEAERRGVDVERSDGEPGTPLKADYIAALGGEA